MKLFIATLTMMVSTAAFAVSVGPVLPPNLTFPPSQGSSASNSQVDYEATAVKAAQNSKSKYFTASTTATEVEGGYIMVMDATTGCQMLVSYENQNDGNVLFVPESQLQCTK